MQKKMVGLLVMPVLIILFSIGFISALGTCSVVANSACTSPDYIVMGLSAETNAHGEFPYSDYPSVLCCDFEDDTGDTACKDENADGISDNKVIGLSSATNAHAEIPSGIIYPVDVCYEDLDCVSISGDCPTELEDYYPIEMVSLSADTNAHIGGFADYDKKICCGSLTYSPFPCTLTDAYWSWNEDGTDAVEADDDPALTGQSVYLIVEGTNCAGETISFEVSENNAGTCVDLPGCTNPDSVVFGSEVGVWKTVWVDDGPFKGDPEYYFIATVEGSSPSETINSESMGNLLLEVSSETVETYCLDSGISSCGDYSVESRCNSDTCNVADWSGEFCDIYLCSCTWDGGECKPSYSAAGECGDGFIDSTEQCESDLDITLTCDSFGFDGGDLSCVNCMIDTLSCNGEVGECGDGIMNPGEQCDGEIGLGFSCADFDAFTGEGLVCIDCMIDASACTGGEIEGTCLITQDVSNECEEDPVGLFTYSWTGIWSPEGSGGGAEAKCLAGGENTIECPAQVQLPFFSVFTIIAALALIALIYVFLIFRKKKK